MGSDYLIQRMRTAELSQVLELVRRVFDEFQASELSAQGVHEFYDSMFAPEKLKTQIDTGLLEIWCCIDGDAVVGMIARRPPAHILLLFVDKKYHRKGIARALFETAFPDAGQEITVNSSLFAVRVYEKLGFQATAAEQTVKGIRFVPMKKPIV